MPVELWGESSNSVLAVCFASCVLVEGVSGPQLLHKKLLFAPEFIAEDEPVIRGFR